ncbi:MAG: TolC family protein [Planctomycetaceae bacterium]
MRAFDRRMLIFFITAMLLPACAQVPFGRDRTASINDEPDSGITAISSERGHETTLKVRGDSSRINKVSHEHAPDDEFAAEENDRLAAANDDSEATVPPAPGGETDGYTLAQIEQIALQNNPALAQAAARVSAGYGRQIQAGLYPNPKAGYMGSEIGSDGTAGQQGAFVEQEFVRGGKLALNQNVAGWEAQRLGWEAKAQEYRVLTSVRQSFYEVLIAQKQVELAERILGTSQEGSKVADTLFKAKQGNRVDLLQARVEANNARILVAKSKNRYQAAWTRLATNLGTARMAPVTLVGEIESSPQELNADDALAQILSNSPELAAARTKIARAQAALERARVEPIPNVEVQAGAQYDYSSNEPIAMLQIGLPIPVHNRNQGNIQAAECELVAAHREVERVQLDLENRLASVLERYRNAQVQIERFRNEILPDVKESLNLVTLGYREQELDYIRFLTAQRTNFQTNIDYLSALQEWWGARLEIEGALLVNGLSAPAGE